MAASHRRGLAPLLALCAAVLVLAWPDVVRAGPEINIPRAEDGPGIKAGQRSTFHPGFALVTGVDTNVFSEDSFEDPDAAAFIMPTGWLGIGNRKFRDGLLMTPPERSGRALDYYIGTILGFRQYLARNRALLGQSRLSGGLQLRLAFLPGRRFSVNADADVFRYAQPSTYAAAPQYNFNRIDGKGQLSFIGRPGGGRFSIAVSPRFRALAFENRTGDEQLARGNRVVPGFGSELKWRFLPKSALVFNYGMDFTYYTCVTPCSERGRGRNEDNFAHRITGGYRGQLLKKVTLDVLAGYGLGYYRADDNGPNFSSFIGDVAFTYYPSPRAMFHVGLYRSFQDSLLGNYYTDVGARLQARYEFKWRMIGTIGTWVAGRQYSGLPTHDNSSAEFGAAENSCEVLQGQFPSDNDPPCILEYAGRGADRFQRRDTVFNLIAKVEQPLGRIFSVALQYDLAVDATNFQTAFQVVSENPQTRDLEFVEAVDFAGFTRHVVMLLGAVRL